MSQALVFHGIPRSFGVLRRTLVLPVILLSKFEPHSPKTSDTKTQNLTKLL